MTHKLKFGEYEICYDLKRKNVKNINLRIKPDGNIIVSANVRVPQSVIDEFVLSKAELIIKALQRYKNSASPPERLYNGGEVFPVLGRDREIILKAGSKNNALLYGENIILIVTDTFNTGLKKKTMDKWLKVECEAVVTRVCQSVYPLFSAYGVSYPEIKFRRMVSQWGNCRKDRKILTFNTMLFCVPEKCIEYVVMHEFTHFLEPNHSKNFYNLLASFMPDWKRRKDILKKYEIRLL